MELRTEIKNPELEQAILASMKQAGMTAAAWLRKAAERQIEEENVRQQQKRQKSIDDFMALREQIAAEGGFVKPREALALLHEVREEYGDRSVS